MTSLLITGLGQGGAETQLVALAQYLKSSGWDIEVVSLLPPTSHSPDTRQFLADLERRDIPVWSPGIASRRASVRGLWALLRHWRTRRPELLCTFMFHANVVGRVLGRLARVPVVVSSIRNERFGPRWRERLEAVTERLGDMTVVNSDAVGASLLARGVVRRGRYRTIPNGVDFVRFAPQPSLNRESTRTTLGIPHDAFLWLAVGRLYPHKDHTSLLRAVTLLRQRHPSVRLAIAGDGPLRESLRQQGQQMGLEDTIHWLGLRRDVPDLLEASDAFVLSSRWEGSPNVVLEALAAGVPVAATDVGGVRELVQHGRSGLLVQPGDVDALAATMEHLMEQSPEERRQMGRRGRQWVRQRHDTATVLEQWRHLLSDVSAMTRSLRLT
jgi:glycosyltransferase involved in cell wall biosynthesis